MCLLFWTLFEHIFWWWHGLHCTCPLWSNQWSYPIGTQHMYAHTINTCFGHASDYSTYYSILLIQDAPLRVASNPPSHSTSSAISPRRTKSYSLRRTPLYHNCQLLAPDGQLLSTIDKKKMEWYLQRGLAGGLFPAQCMLWGWAVWEVQLGRGDCDIVNIIYEEYSKK